MANNSYAFTESAIFCQHASLALLWATVLPLAVICFFNSSYEFIITTCSSWVTYIARVRSVRSIASRWMTLGYALFMWTRIETKAENLAWQIYFKWASWNRLTLIASFVFSNPGFPKKARICSASFVVHPAGQRRHTCRLMMLMNLFVNVWMICNAPLFHSAVSMVIRWASVSARGDVLGDLISYFQL